jgi:hypothetical protein
MPIIQFTAADALQTAMVDAGIYPMQITEIDGPKTSKSEKSINFFTTFRIVDGSFAGKEFTICFNSAVNQASVLGTMQFVPLSTFLQIEAAVKKQKIQVAARPDFDTDALLNQTIDVQVAVDTVDGKLVNTLVGFLPAGSPKGPSW